MKRIGIIGGVGVETTSKFYLDIVQKSKKLKINRNPSIIISSASIPHNIESDFILENKGSERYIPILVSEAKRLEKAEVDFIVMPCNSLHIFIDKLRDSVNIPVLSIVEETVKFILKNNFKKVGLISTFASLDNKLYENVFIKNSIRFISPDKEDQEKIGSIILNLVNGTKKSTDKKELFKIIKKLSKEVDIVLLACTDLQLLVPKNKFKNVKDTMDIFSSSVVDNLI